MKKKHTFVDLCVIGFALFSMFFGAGNVIFPPYLGMAAGTKWLPGFIGYYFADIILALMTLFAMLRKDGMEGIVSPIGNIPSKVLWTLDVLCIGPLVAVPRTAATTYEMSVQPICQILPDDPHNLRYAIICSVVFFLITWLLTIRESAVVDIIGKILTPALVIGLLILIIKGIISPLGPISPNQMVDDIVASGVKSGYQTMDVMTTVLVGTMILSSSEQKGYTTLSAKNKIVTGAGTVAGVLLLIVYCGLTYLGATVSTMYDLTVSRSALVSSIVYSLMGRAGTILFGVVVALACLTTAVGLMSTSARFFNKLFHEKISYPVMLTFLCVFCAVVANVGIEQLVAFASPILDLVYPPTLVLVFLAFFKNVPHLAHRLGVICSVLISAVNLYFTTTGGEVPFHLPLANLGFDWLIPTVVCVVIGIIIGRSRENKKAAPAA